MILRNVLIHFPQYLPSRVTDNWARPTDDATSPTRPLSCLIPNNSALRTVATLNYHRTYLMYSLSFDHPDSLSHSTIILFSPTSPWYLGLNDTGIGRNCWSSAATVLFISNSLSNCPLPCLQHLRTAQIRHRMRKVPNLVVQVRKYGQSFEERSEPLDEAVSIAMQSEVMSCTDAQKAHMARRVTTTAFSPSPIAWTGCCWTNHQASLNFRLAQTK